MLLQTLETGDRVTTDSRIVLDFPRIGRRSFLVNARRVRGGEGEPDLILLAFEDVTEAA